MIQSNIFEKKFSVGLCLNESIEEIENFIKQYHIFLNSIYFSAPLGRKLYSRRKLTEEYDGNEKKLITALEMISKYNIRLELTLNTRDLTNEDIDRAIGFFKLNDINLDEVVCLRDYAPYVRKICPNCEIKYSFNNHDPWMKQLTEFFDTIIVGKGLLRDIDKISEIYKKYNITYMLNNGCSFECLGNCSGKNCYKMLEYDSNKNGLDYMYARSSIFPSELKWLLENNDMARSFKFKISNRPCGIEYTKKALDAYISMEDPIEELKKDRSLFRLFCATNPMAERVNELDIEKILEYKKTLGLSNSSIK